MQFQILFCFKQCKKYKKQLATAL